MKLKDRWAEEIKMLDEKINKDKKTKQEGNR